MATLNRSKFEVVRPGMTEAIKQSVGVFDGDVLTGDNSAVRLVQGEFLVQDATTGRWMRAALNAGAGTQYRKRSYVITWSDPRAPDTMMYDSMGTGRGKVTAVNLYKGFEFWTDVYAANDPDFYGGVAVGTWAVGVPVTFGYIPLDTEAGHPGGGAGALGVHEGRSGLIAWDETAWMLAPAPGSLVAEANDPVGVVIDIKTNSVQDWLRIKVL
jgi:hypothetical protein